MPAVNKAPALTPISQMTAGQKVKGISFISAIALVVGSAIGSGIFFKNKSILDSTQGNIGIAIGCWAVAAIGIIAIGLALLEVATATKKNKAILGWTEKFTFSWFHSWSKGYMALFYYPVTMVSLPLYAVQALSDATGHNFAWWQALLIALAMTTWLLIFSIISTKLASGINWVFTIIKFLPIFLVPIFGFISAADVGVPSLVVAGHSTRSALTSVSPYMGIMASIPAIFFAFDGFYTVASITTDLKSPKRMPWAMGIGILLITAAYLLISSGIFLSSSSGSVSDISAPAVVKAIINYGIFVAVLAIVNGYALSTFKSYDDAIAERDFIIEKKLLKFQATVNMPYFLSFSFKTGFKFAKRTLKVVLTPGFNFFCLSIFVWYGIVALISAFSTFNAAGSPYSYEGSLHEGAMYALADLLTNWSSMVIFVIIAAVLVGGLKNRFSKKVSVVKNRLFIPMSIVGIILVFVPAIYLVVETMAGAAGVNGADRESSLYYLIILEVTLAIGFIFNLYYLFTKRQPVSETAPVVLQLPLQGMNFVNQTKVWME